MSASVTQDDINVQQALQLTVESPLKIQLFCHSTSYIYEDSQRGTSKTFKSPSGVPMTREYGCSWKPVSFYLNCNTICQNSLKKHDRAPDSTGEELPGETGIWLLFPSEIDKRHILFAFTRAFLQIHQPINVIL